MISTRHYSARNKTFEQAGLAPSAWGTLREVLSATRMNNNHACRCPCIPYSPLGISVERIGRRRGRHGGVKQRRNGYSLRTADGIERGENVVVNWRRATNATGSGCKFHVSLWDRHSYVGRRIL
jgi:hypothetical protein